MRKMKKNSSTSNLKMGEKSILFIVLFSLSVDVISSLENSTACYFDERYEAPFVFGDLTDKNCSFTSVTEDRAGDIDECDPSHDAKEYPLFDPDVNEEQFVLSTDLGPTYPNQAKSPDTVLIVAVSNITFQNLTIRLHDLADSNQKIISQTISFEDDNVPEKIYLFFDMATMEFHRTKIQFFASNGRDPKFYKEYHAKIPYAMSIRRREELAVDRIFGYVDTTSRHKVVLHVQSLPQEFNITKYHVEFIDKDHVLYNQFNLSGVKLEHEQNDVPKDELYSFRITPIDVNGKRHDSFNGTVFCMKRNDSTLIIMIVSIPLIPSMAFLVLYKLYYTVYKRKVLDCLKMRAVKVLLVYSATSDFHIAVMVKLAMWLRSCENIIVMLDKLDVPLTPNKDPGHWLDVAFRDADCIIVVASPPPNSGVVVRSTAYKDLDQRAYKLIHENRRHPHKKYLGLVLPYCDIFDTSVDPWLSKRLNMPKDRKKLLNRIHGFSYTELTTEPDPRQLFEIIEQATRSIRHENTIELSRSLENLLELKSVKLTQEALNVDEQNEVDENIDDLMWEDPRANDTEYYGTDIRYLDLVRNENTVNF